MTGTEIDLISKSAVQGYAKYYSRTKYPKRTPIHLGKEYYINLNKFVKTMINIHITNVVEHSSRNTLMEELFTSVVDGKRIDRRLLERLSLLTEKLYKTKPKRTITSKKPIKATKTPQKKKK